MAPTISPRTPSGEHIRHLTRALASGFSALSTRNTAPAGEKLCSVFALVLTSSSSVSRRALSSIQALSAGHNDANLALRSTDTPLSELDRAAMPALMKRQNAILVIPATYAGLNAGPSPGAVVGIILGAIAGFVLCLYILLLSLQFYGGRGTKIVEKEVIIKRKSQSRSKSHRSSRHSQVASEHISVHQSPGPSPSPPQRNSRRETIVEIVEEVRRPSRHRSPTPEPEEVIVEEDESFTEEIVEVIEEQTQSSIVSPSPSPRNHSSSRRSGFRVVDPAEFGGGDAPLRSINSRRSSRHG